MAGLFGGIAPVRIAPAQGAQGGGAPAPDLAQLLELIKRRKLDGGDYSVPDVLQGAASLDPRGSPELLAPAAANGPPMMRADLSGAPRNLPAVIERPAQPPEMDQGREGPTTSLAHSAAPGQPQPAPQQKRPGLFGRGWWSTADEKGLTGADKMGRFGAMLGDIGSSLNGGRPTFQREWRGRIEDRRLADDYAKAAQGQLTGPDGQPLDPLAAYQLLQARNLQAGARGGHIDAFNDAIPKMTQAAQQRAYLQGVPQTDRATAEMDLPGYITRQAALSAPKFVTANQAESIIQIDPRTGKATPVFQGDGKPEPVTPDRITGDIIQRARSGQKLNTVEQQVYDRYLNGVNGEGGTGAGGAISTSRVVGQVLDKVSRVGIQGLSPGEAAIWERYNRAPSNPFEAFMGMAAGMGDDEGGGPAAGPTPRPGPPRTAPNAAPASSGGRAEALPQQARARLKEGQRTTFANGETWTVRGGKPVFLGGAQR